MADAIMSVVHIMPVTVTIMSLIIADIVKMSTIMPSAIAGVMMRFSIIEEVHIIIYQINAELPFILMCVNGTVEMLGSHKAAILHAGEYPTEVIIAYIQKIIITLQRIIIPSHHIVHQVADIVHKVIIHLVHIIVLLRTEFQFVCHTVCEETGILPHFADAHGPHCGNGYAQHTNHYQ